MNEYQWIDASTKPEEGQEVLLWRDYAPLKPKQQTGFRSYGKWTGTGWKDLVLQCPAPDVKFWHPAPKDIPPGEIGH